MKNTKIKRVAVLVETSNAYGREIQLGIADYVRANSRWSMFVEQHELGALPPPWLLRQTWDGIISRPTTTALARAFGAMKVSVVDLNDLHHDLGYPRLQSDNSAIGRLAADHLRDLGLKRYGFCGFAGEAWVTERREGFVQRLKQIGFTASCYQTPWRGRCVLPWAIEQDRLAQWLKQLQPPVGIFSCNDVRGRQVLEVCRRLGYAVPQQFAVVGVDNDELLCRMSDPPLSSVLPDAHRLGFEAASLLDRLMAGRKVLAVVRLIKPRAVVIRQSSDTLAIEDPDVATALRFIRLKGCAGVHVSDVLRVVPLSRSLLERRFRQSIGRSLHAEIRAVQLRKAAQLLEETDRPLKQIASLCGIRRVEYLSYLFNENFGLPPGAYRRRHAKLG